MQRHSASSCAPRRNGARIWAGEGVRISAPGLLLSVSMKDGRVSSERVSFLTPSQPSDRFTLRRAKSDCVDMQRRVEGPRAPAGVAA
jgi:hypothetical protein